MNQNNKPMDKDALIQGAEFLSRRGLRRAKANYVSLVIRQRAELEFLKSMCRDDPMVLDEIMCLQGFIEDSIELMYEVGKYQAPPKGGGGGGGKAA